MESKTFAVATSMTLKQAKQFIDDNRQKAIDINAAKRPFRAIKGFFIAHPRITTNDQLRQTIYDRCVVKGESNEQVLLDFENDFFSDQLEPFIVIETRGNLVTLSLRGYLESGSTNNYDKNDKDL